MKVKGKGFQHCVKYEFQPRKVCTQVVIFLRLRDVDVISGMHFVDARVHFKFIFERESLKSYGSPN